ncbi:polysaccharide biosynthesis/export family protein [Caballeronia humi]|uniref:Polysaccharide export protein n=1 Tax=Caballeronia humi TaxID=326474 RepID=A0A158H3B9_9BURK|nr:polysaccharide biosynthesis/export family protein [Caballeronia humi]SAL38794.1 polysaccharide export protein [Caballeronia humi]
MLTQKQSSTTSLTNNNRGTSGFRLGTLAAAAALCTLFAGCGLAPGMRMTSPPTLVETSNDAGDPATEVNIPITPIDLSLVRKMRAQPASTGPDPLASLYGKSGSYALGVGDVLQITVWDHPELVAALGQPNPNTRTADAAPGFVVDADGNLQFPYVTKPLHVAGKTAEQVQRELYKELSKVFVKPQITVRVASFRSSQVYIDGDVRAPGTQTFNDIPMTLTEAIGRAGGFAPSADQSRVTLLRDGATYTINMAAMTQKGRSPSDIVLKPGDSLRIDSREENGIYVMGEVNKPATVIPMKNGKLTLSDAISQAGSLNQETSNPKETYVIRNGQSDKPEIYRLDARSPVSMLLANNFELQPKDVVYIDNSGLVRFSRVLNLLLPAINAGLTAAIVTK